MPCFLLPFSAFLNTKQLSLLYLIPIPNGCLEGFEINLLFGDMYWYTECWVSERCDPNVDPFAFNDLVTIDAVVLFIFDADIVLVN